MSTVQRSAPAASVAGGALTAVATFLSWSRSGVSITGPLGTSTEEGTTSSAGVEITEGKVILAVGILVVIAALARVVLKGGMARRVAQLLVLAGAVAILFVGITEVLAISGEEGFELSGLTESGEEVTIGAKTTVGLGLWLTIAGGILAAVGAVLGFLGGPSPSEGPLARTRHDDPPEPTRN